MGKPEIKWKRKPEITLKENGERDLEADVSIAVLRIASEQPGGSASNWLLKLAVPSFVAFDDEVRKAGDPPPDEFWEEQISQICKNRLEEGNMLRNGYAAHHPDYGFRITDYGREFLRSKGYRGY